MKLNQTNNYQDRNRQSKPMRRPGLSRSNSSSIPDITIQDILRHLATGLLKLWIAIRYQFHRLTGGAFLNLRLPWYKLALAALAFFILAKKDVQFSINMKAPLSAFAGGGGSPEQMGMVQPVALKQPASPGLDEQRALAYIQRFARVAREERDKFGIPASIKMAQALLESRAGENPEAVHNNNHFGPALAGRQFGNAWESWRAHSLLIRQEYPELFKAGTSAKAWARGLQRAGFSDNGNYAAQLLELIGRYQLNRLDEI